jgi:cell division protease FtsH
MAKALMKYETIDDSQVKDIMDGREPKPPADWEESTDSTPPGGEPKSKSDAPTIGGPATEN